MPFVNIKITRDGATREQKATVVREITRTLERVLGKRPDQTHIIIDEVDPDNWGFSGVLATEYRKKNGVVKHTPHALD
jgi:4-oxalocrotonate tautomerase